jgi:mannose-6-phosphate isomerase-like protein (cupin superfamily)
VPAYTVARLSDIPAAGEPEPGSFVWLPVRHTLGVKAFGVNGWLGRNAGDDVIEAHRETPDGEAGVAQAQEELYYVASGHATFTIDGETVDAPEGTLVFVAEPGAERSAVAKEDGTTVLAIGAPVGEGFVVAPWERKHFGD